MEKIIEQKISDIFNRIEVHPPYSSAPIKITQFSWNKNMKDFKVVYYLAGRKYVFHYNQSIASEIDVPFSKDPLEQLENEVLYMKRMYERGIGGKDCYPFMEYE